MQYFPPLQYKIYQTGIDLCIYICYTRGMTNHDIQNKIGELIGEVSVAWTPRPSGTFDSEKAVELLKQIDTLIGERVIKELQAIPYLMDEPDHAQYVADRVNAINRGEL